MIDVIHRPSEALSLEAAQIRERVRDELFGTSHDTLRYKILNKVGAGGEGVVYRARDPILDCDVALKEFHAHTAHDNALVERLREEAIRLARLRQQPHIVTLYDFFSQDDRTYVVMEFVTGASLRLWQAVSRPWHALLGVYLQAGEGLAAAHAVDVVHRDFKPDNVLVDEHGVAKVADFGVANIPTAHTTGELRDGGHDDTTATDHPGTRRYMAPEQFAGGHTTPASDQYSFCVALYEALYGAHPTLAPGAASPLPAVRDVRPPPTTRVPRHIFHVLRRGLSVRPADRYPTMQALLADLRRRPARRNALVAATLLTLTAIVYLLVRPPRPVIEYIHEARAELDARLHLGDLRHRLGERVPESAAARLAADVDAHAARMSEVTGKLRHDDHERLGDDTRKRLECIELAADDLTGLATNLRTAAKVDLAAATAALAELAEPRDCLTLPAAPLRCRVDELVDRRRPDAAPVLAALAAGERQELAGDWRTAVATTAAAAAAADRLPGATLLQTRAHYAHGRLLQLAEQPDGALEALTRARALVEARECLDLRTDIAGRMVKITAQNPGTPLAPALDWSRTQLALAEFLKDDRRIAQAHSDRGLLSLLRAGDPELHGEPPDLVLRELTTAITIRDTRLATVPAAEQADTLLNLSAYHRTHSNLPEARRTSEAAIQQRTRAYGPDHPQLYRDLRARALVEVDEGNAPAALATLDAALDLARRGYAETSSPYVTLLFNRIQIAYDHGRVDEALRSVVPAAELAFASRMDPVIRLEFLTGCATMLAANEQHTKAQKILEEILKQPPPARMLVDNPTIALGLAEAYAHADRPSIAEAFADQALLGFQALSPDLQTPDIVTTRLLLAQLRIHADRYSAAVEELIPVIAAAPRQAQDKACRIYRTYLSDTRLDDVVKAQFTRACS